MNVRNTYFRFVLAEYSSFQHGEPSVFWSAIQNHMNWLKKPSKMNFGTLFFAATNAHGKDDEEFTRLYPDGIVRVCTLRTLPENGIDRFKDTNVESGHGLLIR